MGSPIRILHVVVNMNRGGAETVIMNLYRNIDRTKVQFDFLTCKKGVFDPEITRLGGRIYRIPYVTEIGHFKYIKVLNHFFQTHNEYKIVHSHMDKMSGFVLRSAAKAGIPFRIAHSHNTNSEGGRLAKIYKWYAGTQINSANYLVACSEKAAIWLFKDKASKATILKNAIDCSKFEFSKEQREKERKILGIQKEQLVVGHVGRFNHQKNHEFLIDILKETLKENKNAVLLLVGTGELLPTIQKKVENLGLTAYVKFLGVRNDVHLLFQAMDVFVFPSLHEGLPLTLIEAQCSGLPCLISDRITNEVDMGVQSIEYLPINDAGKWKDSIMKYKNEKKRTSRTKYKIQEKGYEIKISARIAQDMYFSMAR